MLLLSLTMFFYSDKQYKEQRKLTFPHILLITLPSSNLKSAWLHFFVKFYR